MSDVDRHAVLVALLRRVGPLAPGLVERLETDGADRVLAEALGAGTQLLAEDPGPLIGAAQRDLARWRASGIRPVSVLDDRYPANLRAVHDRPAVLFLAGELRPSDDRAVAVVGSRRASDAGRARAAAIATDLGAAGITVLSGLAAGIDTAAHRAALAAGRRTVAVIGAGHEHAYPPENAALQRHLAIHQAVVSPFWPDVAPSANGFRRRNGVMSGLSRGTVIVEASARSGTRIQARLALAHGRPVFLLGGLLRETWAVELARRPGVHVVDGAADVVALLERQEDLGPLTAPAG